MFAEPARSGEPYAEVTTRELSQMVGQLYPKVAVALGRDPVRTPQVGVLHVHELYRLYDALPPTIGERPQVTFSARARSQLAELERASLALYVPATDRIYVVQENIERALMDRVVDVTEVRPFLRCVLAHELVHAVQQIYGWQPAIASEQEETAWLALHEGQATLVGLELCAAWEGEPFARRLAQIQGITPSTAIGGGAAVYAFGRSLVAQVRAEDPELVWTALRERPPAWADVLTDHGPLVGPGPGWDDPVPLRRLTGDRKPEGMDTPTLRRLLDLTGLPPASAGWGVSGDGLSAVVLRFDEPGAPEALIASRARAVAVRPSLLPRDAIARAASGAYKVRTDLPVVRSFRSELWLADGGMSAERWLATDDVLVMVKLTGSHVRRDASDLSLAILQAYPSLPRPAASPPSALAPWYERLRAAPADTRAPSPDWLLTSAARRWQSREVSPCRSTFAPVLDAFVEAPHPEAGLADPHPWQAAAYQCAAASDEWDFAESLVGALPSLDLASAQRHALALVRMQKFDDALALLAKVAAVGPDEARALADTRIAVYGSAGRWTELAAAATEPTGSLTVRRQAAAVLQGAGRVADARRVNDAVIRDASGAAP